MKWIVACKYSDYEGWVLTEFNTLQEARNYASQESTSAKVMILLDLEEDTNS